MSLYVLLLWRHRGSTAWISREGCQGGRSALPPIFGGNRAGHRNRGCRRSPEWISENRIVLQGVADSSAIVEKAIVLAQKELPDFKIESTVSIVQDFKAYP